MINIVRKMSLIKQRSQFHTKVFQKTNHQNLNQSKLSTSYILTKNQPFLPTKNCRQQYKTIMTSPNSMMSSGSASAVRNDSNMVWIDCEMSGLDIDKDCLLEIVVVITDSKQNILDTIEIVLHRPEEVLTNMGEWCMKTHTETGLVDKCRKSTINVKQAENMLLEFVSKYINENKAPMCGNSIYMDRLFIMKELSLFNNYLHYRIIDISSLKELCRRYNPKIFSNVPKKRWLHRGYEDIIDTIEEFKYYKQHFLQVDNLEEENKNNEISSEFGKAVPFV